MSAAVTTGPEREVRRSWLPMTGLFLGQILMSFNVSALPISVGGMVNDFGVPMTVASSTIVVYGLVVATLVMTGAKLGQRVGWVVIFRVVVVSFACSSLLMIFSPSVCLAIAGQALAGAALLVGLLSAGIGRAVIEHPELPQELVAQVDLDSVNFVSNAEPEDVLSRTDATDARVDEAVRLNEEERLRALKLGLLVLAGVSALAFLPASRLPHYHPHELPTSDAVAAD